MSSSPRDWGDPFNMGKPSSERRVLGIDPGVHGALGLLSLRGFDFVDAADMPVRDRGKTVTTNVLDVKRFRTIIETWRPEFAVLEHSRPMPNMRKGGKACPACGHDTRSMGAASAFNYGDMFGSLRTALEVLGVEVVLVQPVVWKRAAGLKRGDKSRAEVKAESLALARQLWPSAPLELAKHEGRAEALLLARFGLLSQARLL